MRLLIIHHSHNLKMRIQSILLLHIFSQSSHYLLQSVKVQKEGVRQLPIAIEDTYIYQEADMLMIESAHGFSMQCNFKFDVCTFTLSGKFFLFHILFSYKLM
jgi:hypothetical protein